MRALKNHILRYEKLTNRKNKNLRWKFNHYQRQHSYLKGGGESCHDVVSDLRHMKTLLKNAVNTIERIDDKCTREYGRDNAASVRNRDDEGGSDVSYMGMGEGAGYGHDGAVYEDDSDSNNEGDSNYEDVSDSNNEDDSNYESDRDVEQVATLMEGMKLTDGKSDQ